jgi:ethanolamine ammonia-lyase large subunit
MDSLAVLLTTAGCNFLIAVPGADDVMLNYQSLSYHDVVSLRHLFHKPPAPEFEAWLRRMGMLDADGRLAPAGLGAPHARRLLDDAAAP